MRATSKRAACTLEVPLFWNKVTRYLGSQDLPRYKQRESRATKLEPFHGFIVDQMKAAAPDWIAAPALLREVQALGYRGKLLDSARSIVRRPADMARSEVGCTLGGHPNERVQSSSENDRRHAATH